MERFSGASHYPVDTGQKRVAVMDAASSHDLVRPVSACLHWTTRDASWEGTTLCGRELQHILLQK